jgi:hypothetical protein
MTEEEYKLAALQLREVAKNISEEDLMAMQFWQDLFLPNENNRD